MATCVSWRTQQALTDTYQYDAFDMPIASTGTTSNNYLYSGEQGILLSGTLTAQIERERHQIERERQRRFYGSLPLRMCRPPEKPVPIGRRRTNLCRAHVRPGTIWPIPKPRSFERRFSRFKLFVTT